MKLNLGCGNDYREGWVNVDRGDCKCDVEHDLFEFPYPFEDSSVDAIFLSHMMEHFPKDMFVDVVRELYRICRNDAEILIISPHAGSDNFWTDPTHSMPLTSRTFDYFDRTKPLFENGEIYGWDDVNFLVQAEVVPNEPNGPDVKHLLKVIK
jgi:SAM-dependent methyltransferase